MQQDSLCSSSRRVLRGFQVAATRSWFKDAPVRHIYVTEVALPGFIGGELMKWLRVYEMFTLAMCNDCATSNTAAGVVFIRVAVACRPSSSSSSSSHMAVERYNDSCWPTT